MSLASALALTAILILVIWRLVDFAYRPWLKHLKQQIAALEADTIELDRCRSALGDALSALDSDQARRIKNTYWPPAINPSTFPLPPKPRP